MDFDEVELDMIRRGDMLGPKLGAKLVAALETLQRERDEAREALRPFAVCAGMISESASDNDPLAVSVRLFRRARAALTQGG